MNDSSSESEAVATPPAPIARRAFLVAGSAVLGGAVLGGVAVATGIVEVPERIQRLWEGSGPTADVPDAGVGQVTLERRVSEARGREVGFFTAVPAGFGDGAGLPVCIVLHGFSATTADFEDFGLPQFLTAAVEAGVPPFVLVGADGGQIRWEPVADDDPQRMLRDEVPRWCAERGWDAERVAAHGWSMGGYGALLCAALSPGWLRSVGVLSPAVGGGLLSGRVDELDGSRIGMWCGTDDDVFDGVERLADRIPGGPAVAGFGPGRHTRGYWNTVTPAAFEFIGRSLST